MSIGCFTGRSPSNKPLPTAPRRRGQYDDPPAEAPAKPPPRLREIAPEVRAICERWGVEYKTDSWGRTLGKALRPTALENFLVLVALLRDRAPRAAPARLASATIRSISGAGRRHPRPEQFATPLSRLRDT